MNPITREESLLDGQDLTPITRKEQFIKRIYDKTQEVPIPVTREEWFLKKAGEGTSPVTIEQLNVTENGTYSEQGKAYSPVIVEVPAPTLITKTITENGTYTASEDNADGYSQVTVAVEGFKKKSIANTPTDIASFNDGTANPMPSLEISIVPVQSGSGDPSPSNVRPISGWSGAQITVTDDLTTPTETHTISIPFRDSSDNPITVYGGRLDVTAGELTVTHAKKVLNGTESWSMPSQAAQGYSCYRYFSSEAKQGASVICDRLKNRVSINYSIPSNVLTVYDSSGSAAQWIVSISNDLADSQGQTSTDAFLAWLAQNNLTVLYELATPQTYQLTPAQVTTLLGQNNIFADCGQVLDGEYFVTL